ncbi:MAG: hypothetical protein U9Q07_07440 [Planctomycetota bacterium]|nr:hypothetical protein [Planctomycetota bacterium]
MYPRKSYVRRKNKTYLYVQLVHGYRRPEDKASRQRVVANLGQMTEQQFENLQLAFRASREGQAVVISDETRQHLKRDKVKANLDYLHVAVLCEVWDSWGLSSVLSDLIGTEDTAVPTCDVIKILTLQRCVAPGSKLYAQEWFPTTALPELLGIPPRHFNNTRVHRALDALFKCTPQLQEKFTDLYQDRQAAFAAMFIDVTDTYFEGRGCESARRSRTKAGHRNKWCIGIVLLADEKGFPLRWTVIPGRTKDHIAMADMIAGIKDLDWAQDVPLVCDRAMGRQTCVRNLYDTGLHFLTAASVNSIESYTTKLPWEVFSKIEIEETEASRQKDIELVVKCAGEQEDLDKVDNCLFVMDLGVVAWSPEDNGNGQTGETGRRPSGGNKRGRTATGIQERLQKAGSLRAKIDSAEFGSVKDLAHALGVTSARVYQLLNPLRLSQETQRFILALEEDVPVSEARLREMLKARNAREQRKLIQDTSRALPQADSGTGHPDASQPDTDDSKPPYTLRLAAYFNPQMFVDKRRRAREHLDELQKFVAELNTELSNAKKSRQKDVTRRKIVQRLEKNNYLDLFDISLERISPRGGNVTSFRCELKLKREEWERRHRYNGFVLLLAHPHLKQSGRELALLYRAKDRVEKDFQGIKSLVSISLRPIYHHTDPKVVAHVDLCMKSLLLERSLEERLADAGLDQTAAATIRQLKTCHLNLMKPAEGGPYFYSVTEATRQQRRVLNALDLSQLIDDDVVAGKLTPRVVTT